MFDRISAPLYGSDALIIQLMDKLEILGSTCRPSKNVGIEKVVGRETPEESKAILGRGYIKRSWSKICGSGHLAKIEGTTIWKIKQKI